MLMEVGLCYILIVVVTMIATLGQWLAVCVVKLFAIHQALIITGYDLILLLLLDVLFL